MEIRDAAKADARDLAVLGDLAGEGIPVYLWRQVAERGESPLDAGARRAARDDANFSYRNARVCVEDSAVLGMLLAYRLADPYEIGDLSGYPEVVRPLVLLETRAAGTWYVNAIATYAKHRGRGVARMLLADAEDRALVLGCDRLSLIVASENTRAKALYQRLGFEDTCALPAVPYPGCAHGGDWVLMIKRIAGA